MVRVKISDVDRFPTQTTEEYVFHYLAHVSCSITVWANAKELTKTVSSKKLFVTAESNELFIKNKDWTNICTITGEPSDFKLEDSKPFYQISTINDIKIHHIQSRIEDDVISENELRKVLFPYVL